MEDHVKALQRTIKPGAKRLNWSSLAIQDYVTKCEEALTKFESLTNQVLKNARDIEERLQSIESACLYRDPFADRGQDGKLMEAKVRKVVCVELPSPNSVIVKHIHNTVHMSGQMSVCTPAPSSSQALNWS